MGATPKIRGVSGQQLEEEVRAALIQMIREDAGPLGLEVVHDSIVDKGHPAFFVAVPEDEGEEDTGGTYLVTIHRVSTAIVQGSGGVFGE